jgi:hypothetical protein
MTPEERREHLRKQQRWIRAARRELELPHREKRLRQGRAMPRTQAELAIFAKDLLDDPEGDDDRPRAAGS